MTDRFSQIELTVMGSTLAVIQLILKPYQMAFIKGTGNNFFNIIDVVKSLELYGNIGVQSAKRVRMIVIFHIRQTST